MKKQFYWTSVKIHIGDLILIASKKGMCWIGYSREEGLKWLKKNYENIELIENNQFKLLKKAVKEFNEYSSSELKTFTVPLDFHGTVFQEKVWRVLEKIDYGKTKTYQEVAKLARSPLAVRAVGNACNKNSLMIIIPCHRVVGKNGKLVGYAGGLDVKEKLLRFEKAIK